MNNEHNKPEERWIKFQIGSAFPATSILARWISGLTIIGNDLLQINKVLLEEANLSGEKTSPEALFYFWLVCSQLREAAKFLHEGSKNLEVQTFIESLPDEAIAQWKELQSSYEPWEGSFVESVVKQLRDRTFHYPEPNCSDWESALRSLASEESGVRVKNDMRVGDIRGAFADDLRAFLLSDYLGSGKDNVATSMEKVANLTSSLMSFAQQSLTSYLKSLPKNVIRFEDTTGC